MSWAKLPQSWILQGKEKGRKKITKKCKLFLNGKEQEKRVNAGVKKKKMVVIDHLVTLNSTVLNNELNWGGTDWIKERGVHLFDIEIEIEYTKYSISI